MKSFWWNIDGEPVEIIFSLVRNGRWAEYEGERVGVRFDYLDHESVGIALADLEEMPEVHQMLLQVLNLEAT